MTYQALVARENTVALETITDEDLPNDGVTIDVAYSSLNYKDALAVTRRGRIVRRFPMVLGIDLAGTDIETGAKVLAVGQGLGESEWGGYTQRERVRADALVPLPDGMSLEQSMQLGTAGFTAMLCVLALERNEVLPDEREVVVTGAAGGVGSIAVMLLSRLGYRVAASTGRPELEPYLRGLGATSIVAREELAQQGAPMQSERWAGGIDTVGGTTLANVFAQTSYGGAIACCGMAGGHELAAAVWPLILRNVSLLGVSSIRTPRARRLEAWSRLARDVDFAKLAELSGKEPLSRVFELSEELLAGRVRGRVVIEMSPA
ncbi:MAG TPA: MDR family oxidoreductase [Thermoanaerobaculia bacterium]|nr:MDR family oxidoreductase [Thermoanaerobaculia bacterium]